MYYMFHRAAIVQKRDEQNPQWVDVCQIVLQDSDDMEHVHAKYSEALNHQLSYGFEGQIRLAIFAKDRYGIPGNIPYTILQFVDTRNRRK